MIESALRFASALERAPYAARLGFVCGEMTGDAVTASVPYAASLANAQGFVHGGVAASLSVWSGMIVAVASDRDRAQVARPVSASISFLVAAREEDLHATARLAWRGREIVHVEVEVSTDRGRPVASALLVLRTSDEQPPVSPKPLPPPAVPTAESRRLISPFSRWMGADVRSHDGREATMFLRHDLNEGADGGIDPGALIALSDTCAAVACVPSLDERILGSATLSIAAVFGDAPTAAAIAVGRQITEAGSVRSALVDIRQDGAAASRHSAMTACVTYRFLGADLVRGI